MAQETLVDALIEAGALLVDRLSTSAFNPESALWLYRPETEDWVLMLGSSNVRRRGPSAAYAEIDTLLRSGDFGPLHLDDVVVSDNEDPLLRLLRGAMRTGPGLGRTRFSKNRIGTAFIEDALIYRLQDSTLQPQSA